MSIAEIIHRFIQDDQTKTLLTLIALDVVLGVAAAFKAEGQTFALSYLANFLRNDVLGKVVPFFALDAAAFVAGSSNVLISQLDVGNMAHVAFAAAAAAMVGSIISSLKDLGLDGDVIPTQLGRG